MNPCAFPLCGQPARMTVHVRAPGWAVAEPRRVCKHHHAEIERARMAADARCAVPGCPTRKLARHLCAEHIDAAHSAGALGLLGWWPTSERSPTEDEVQRLVAEMRRGRAA